MTKLNEKSEIVQQLPEDRTRVTIKSPKIKFW